jgi:hypothetical protein
MTCSFLLRRPNLASSNHTIYLLLIALFLLTPFNPDRFRSFSSSSSASSSFLLASGECISHNVNAECSDIDAIATLTHIYLDSSSFVDQGQLDAEFNSSLASLSGSPVDVSQSCLDGLRLWQCSKFYRPCEPQFNSSSSLPSTLSDVGVAPCVSVCQFAADSCTSEVRRSFPNE